MVYLQKFVAVLKLNGKILRERDDVVHLPFGAEYSILLKNLNTKNALVKITIDGREVTDGGIIVPHSFNNVVELERFIDSGDLSKGYKFKFIKKTKEIQDNRGDYIDDGLIRVEWWFEEEQPYYRSFERGRSIMLDYYTNHTGTPNKYGSVTFSSSSMYSTCSVSPVNNVDVIDNNPLDDEGITVEGSDSFQKFIYSNIGRLEPMSQVVIFKLKGYSDKKQIKKPLFVQSTIKCRVCGRTSKSDQSNKFCSGCGARLIV